MVHWKRLGGFSTDALLLLMIVAWSAVVAAASHDELDFQCPRAIFAFGDSYTDTGDLMQVTTGLDGYNGAERHPYGLTYFGRPVDRFSDGRLIIDFLSQAFGHRLLDPSLENIAPDFRQGISFAMGGAQLRSESFAGILPFYLGLQVNQAIRFYHRSLDAAPRALVPNPASFGTRGLYFMFGGVNDMIFAIQTNTSVDRIRSVILPEIVSNVSLAITRLYNTTGARQFLVLGVTPFGCTALALGSGLPAINPAYGPLGQDGCAQGINDFAKEYNALLLLELQSMRTRFPETTIVYVDTYSIVYNAVTNPSRYGFSEGIAACCGAGGPPYNFNVSVGQCGDGSGAATVCSDPSQFVIWDGVHYTEALHKLVVTTILQGKFVDPAGFNLSSLCHLDFRMFNATKEGGRKGK